MRETNTSLLPNGLSSTRTPTAMESSTVRHGVRRAIVACQNTSNRRAFHQSSRCLATSAQAEGIKAAAPIRFSANRNQFSKGRPRAQLIENDDTGSSGRGRDGDSGDRRLMRNIRIVPASPSYFTATPRMTDDMLHLSQLLRKYQTLPVLPTGEAPRVAWKTRQQYKIEVLEPVRAKDYNMILTLLKRLNYIHPSLIPSEVIQTLEKYKRLVQPHLNKPKPIEIDQHGRARAVGKRKTSTAAVFLVEGDGKCLINNKSLTTYFGRLHDRESALWALKATERLDKYNVWALVRGGGLTGQADAIALGLGKALLAHEPDLKPALRKGELNRLCRVIKAILTRHASRCAHSRPSTSREEEAWKAQSPQDASLGQAVVLYIASTFLYQYPIEQPTWGLLPTPDMHGQKAQAAASSEPVEYASLDFVYVEAATLTLLVHSP